VAVRFDAATEEYTRAASLGTVTQFAISCWVKLSVDLGSISTIWCVDNGFSGDFIRLSTDTDGNTLVVTDDTFGDPHAVGSLAVGTWCHVAIAFDGVNATAVFRGASDTTNTITTWADSSPSTSIVNLRIGDAVFDGQYFNGCVAAFKLWTGVALNQADLEAEAWTYMPRRTNGIRAWYPFLRAETTDYSGLGSTLSGGSGTTTEDGPPVSWGPRRRTVYAPAPASTPISLADSASAADSLAADVDAPAADSATAADSLTVAVTAPLADTAVADEQMTVAVTVDLADAATADDVAIVGNPVSLADAATADDTWTTIPTPVLDEQAAGDDTLTITATASLADAATASDQITVAQTLPKDLADTATASDSLTVVLLQDITVTATSARRGWAAGQPGDGWDSGDLARSWTSSPAERSWPGGDPARGWSARPPTT
jgi:hypothetical protein